MIVVLVCPLNAILFVFGWPSRQWPCVCTFVLHLSLSVLFMVLFLSRMFCLQSTSSSTSTALQFFSDILVRFFTPHSQCRFCTHAFFTHTLLSKVWLKLLFSGASSTFFHYMFAYLFSSFLKFRRIKLAGILCTLCTVYCLCLVWLWIIQFSVNFHTIKSSLLILQRFSN